MSIFTPWRSEASLSDGPPKRLLPDRRPLPVPLGAAGGGVSFAALGVGAEDDDFDGAVFTSGIFSFEACDCC